MALKGVEAESWHLSLLLDPQADGFPLPSVWEQEAGRWAPRSG